MSKNIIPLLIVLAVVFSAFTGIFLLSNQKNQAPDINFNPTSIPSPTNGIINNNVPSVTAVPINMNDIKTMPDGLKIYDEAVGTGKEVKSEDTVTVNYVGYLENGTKFDSSYDRNSPLTIQIGVGQVIKGWDEGIVGMKVGGKRRLMIPSRLGYGASGAGSSIPPNANLVFDVELLSVK